MRDAPIDRVCGSCLELVRADYSVNRISCESRHAEWSTADLTQREAGRNAVLAVVVARVIGVYPAMVALLSVAFLSGPTRGEGRRLPGVSPRARVRHPQLQPTR